MMPVPQPPVLHDTGRHHLPKDTTQWGGYARHVSREVFDAWNWNYHRRQCDVSRRGGEHHLGTTYIGAVEWASFRRCFIRVIAWGTYEELR